MDGYRVPMHRLPRKSPEYSLRSGFLSFDVQKDILEVKDFRFFTPEDFYGGALDQLLDAHHEVTQAAPERTAWDYMTAHYPDPPCLNSIQSSVSILTNTERGFTVRNLRIARRSLIKHDINRYWITYYIKEYRFSFIDLPDSLMFSPRQCHVVVEALTGRVRWFDAETFPINVSVTATVSKARAMKTAMAALVIRDRPESAGMMGIIDPVAGEPEHLVYVLTFSGDGPRMASYACSNTRGRAVSILCLFGGR